MGCVIRRTRFRIARMRAAREATRHPVITQPTLGLNEIPWTCTQGSAAAQPWALIHYPVGIREENPEPSGFFVRLSSKLGFISNFYRKSMDFALKVEKIQ